jgi:hypothetical protein
MSVCVVDCRATPRHVASRAQSVGEEGLKKMLSATPLDFSKFNPGAPVRSSPCPCFALPALARSAAAAAAMACSVACLLYSQLGWFVRLAVCLFVWLVVTTWVYYLIYGHSVHRWMSCLATLACSHCWHRCHRRSGGTTAMACTAVSMAALQQRRLEL